MSAKRQADMADIQNAIETGITKRREDFLFRANVEQELKARGQLSDEDAIDATIANANDQLTQDERLANADQALMLKRQSLIKAQAQKAYKSGGRAVNSVKNGIGRIPMPTGLWLPIVVLLVLSMLLIQINGNTRLGWLWLVMTGNAELPSAQAQGVTSAVATAAAAASNAVSSAVGTAKGGGGPPAMMYVPRQSYELDEW